MIIDFEGKIDGVPFDGGSAKNYPFVLGQGQMLPEFEKGILGMKEDESKDVEVSFPEDYHGKDVAGKTAVFTITVHNVAEATLPEVDEVFARALGIADGDVAKMRAEVQKNVESIACGAYLPIAAGVRERRSAPLVGRDEAELGETRLGCQRSATACGNVQRTRARTCGFGFAAA